MSPRYPRLTGKEILRTLQRMGIEMVRQRGSHVIVKSSEGKVSVIKIALLSPILFRGLGYSGAKYDTTKDAIQSNPKCS